MTPILVSRDAGVLSLTLNRPDKLNAFNPEMHRLLREALEEARDEPGVRAVLLTGSGRGFCAGQDLSERNVGADAAPIDLSVSLGSNYNPLVRRLRALPKPVVCAVNGVAAGAGANIALACDIVLAARSASFVQSFSRLGLVPDSGGTYFLPRLVGSARAMGLALLGERLSAEEAERWGLIWKAVEDERLVEEATGIAQTLARPDQRLWPDQASHPGVRGELARRAARLGARLAARGRVLGGLPRRGRRVHAEAQAAVQGQVKTFSLEPIETARPAALRALQLERLQWTLQHAYDDVPHYRRKFDAAGVKPGDCRSLEDLARFPFTTKADLRDTYPFGMFAVPMDRIVRIHASSGTTGKPTVVGYTAKDIDTWAQLMARSIRAAGARPGDKVHVAYGYGLFTGGLGAHYGAERLGLAVIPLGGGMTERQVQLIRDFEPDIIMVTPSYMLAIADEMERQGIDPRASSLRIGIFGAEPWSAEMRRSIESRLALEAIDLYGLSEVMGPGVAQECIETKDGLTVWEDHFYPEIVDPASGAPLADGENGELVFTSLTKEALPVIRYRTRDLTRLLPPTARAMRRMERISGRSDDMLIIRGVNVFPSQIEELILKQPGLSPHYVLEVSKEGPLDHLTVVVEGDAGATAGLRHSIKSYIGVSADVKIGTIERSIGKAKRVIDKRPK